MRKSRLGEHGGRWIEQTMETKMDWCRAADVVLDDAKSFDIKIVDRDMWEREIIAMRERDE
jgi:hypothetical protein